jgi:acyl-CoA synthetase (AMP-forming)/AMP-acid ligase II
MITQHFAAIALEIEASTLVDRLRDLADRYPHQLAYTFLSDGKEEGQQLTYAALEQRVRAIAALLQREGRRGERALLLYPQGLEVIAAFCGCLYAGVIAVPVPSPEAGRLKRALPRLKAILQDSQASLVLTTDRTITLLKDLQSQFPEFAQMRWIDTEQIDVELASTWQDPQLNPHNLAYLQYTSGSTATPKGVMVSQHNLMHHCAYLTQANGYTPQSVTVTWMPYFHDYGLVEGLIQPLYNGTPGYLLSPFTFIKHPLSWLEVISRYHATHSQAPNFAYDLCIQKHPGCIPDLDLSHWEVAGNAAEPINPHVIDRFCQTFAPYGFRPQTFAPAYGLAENTLLVSAKPTGTSPVSIHLEIAALEKHRVVEKSAPRSGTRTYVSCGRPIGDTRVEIVNPETRTRCVPNAIGEIWVFDPSIARGYWKRPEETRDTFQAYLADVGEGFFLRTGDLGFIKDGELYITGRLKDLIIIRGTNHHPQDLEWTVQQVHSELRSNCGAAFSIEVNGEEKLVIVQEVERRAQNLDLEAKIVAIRQAIAEEHELQTYAIVLAKPGSLLKTSSGKIQRRACRDSFLAGELAIVADWCESPRYTAEFRNLQDEIDSLVQQLSVRG